jgi:hypothetical protein
MPDTLGQPTARRAVEKDAFVTFSFEPALRLAGTPTIVVRSHAAFMSASVAEDKSNSAALTFPNPTVQYEMISARKPVPTTSFARAKIAPILVPKIISLSGGRAIFCLPRCPELLLLR